MMKNRIQHGSSFYMVCGIGVFLFPLIIIHNRLDKKKIELGKKTFIDRKEHCTDSGVVSMILMEPFTSQMQLFLI